jgi:xylose isomerase
VQTVELLVALRRANYGGIIYFDTFPDHSGLNPVDEARANIRQTDRLVEVAARLAGDPALQAAQARQDGAAATLIVMGALLGA